MTGRSDNKGANTPHESGHPDQKVAHNNPSLNTIIFSDTMERRMAEHLLSDWHIMPELVGVDSCGANPYQYVRSLEHKNLEIMRLRDKGERYQRYKIIDPVSRAALKNALIRG